MNLAEQATRAQITNIFAKLKAGKTISKREQAQVEAYERGQAPPKTTREWASHYGVSHVAIIKWGKAGAPLKGTVEEMDAWRAAKVKETPVGLSDAKLRKTMLEVERLEIQNAQARGELINRAEVREAGVEIGAILSAECQALVNDLTGQIAGQSEEELRPKLQSRIDLLLDRVKAKLHEST
jgi:hypothetical protein